MNDKIFLASFRKSGNTWVSFIIANLYNLLQPRFEEIDFHNIHGINPQYREGENVKPVFPDFPQILTTHSLFKDEFERVILLIRNPRDTLLSLHHYLKGERHRDIPIPELVRSENNGIPAIVSHSQSYLKKQENLLIITYENLHQNPVKEVKKIVDFIGVSADQKTMRTAVEKAKFKAMRKVELAKGRKFGTPGFLFTRSGKTGEGVAAFKKHEELDRYITAEIKRNPLLHLVYG